MKYARMGYCLPGSEYNEYMTECCRASCGIDPGNIFFVPQREREKESILVNFFVFFLSKILKTNALELLR